MRLPNSLYEQLRELAKQEGVSVNQLISAAVGEKLAALMTLEYLEQRAEQGSRKRFEAVLKRVSAEDPADRDRLPAKKRRKSR